MLIAHADVVGSLLRPAELVQARADVAGGQITAAAFKAIEDRAVDAAVALQEDAGLPVVSDGEMRRLSFQSLVAESADGFGEWDLDAFLWGDWRGGEALGDQNRPRPAKLGVTDTLRRRRYPIAEEFTYLRARTRQLPKIALPSPSLWANFWSPAISTEVYPTLDSFLADVLVLLRDDVAELVRLGATYIQIDAPHYALFLDPSTRGFYEAQGWSLDRWLSMGTEMDNALMHGFPDVTFGLHVCRGNQGSRWLAAGGYEPLVKAIFRGTRAQRLLLEYDDARSGDFEPLGEVPEDKVVVLGLITTKAPELEVEEDLEERIRAAARYVPLERLALSPQCGFASSVIGNTLNPLDQRRKLRLVVETAERVWGTVED